ncbi:MAG: carbohydrate ABC transporter permease, partial [Kiritimatiellia bacterium]
TFSFNTAMKQYGLITILAGAGLFFLFKPLGIAAGLVGLSMLAVSRFDFPHRPSRGELAFNTVNVLLLGLLAFSTLYPFLYVLSLSFSTQAEAMRDGFHLYPREVTLTAYRMVFSNPDILTGYMNTIFRTVVGTVMSVTLCCMCAYPLSRKDLPHRGMFTFLLVFTMLFHGGLVPTYLLIKNIGLLNSIWVYILPMCVQAFNVIIIKNFFQAIPESLGESASIDGAGDWRILFQIYLPLSKPVLATVSLWTAVTHWNSWFDGLIFITDDSKQILQIFLRRIVVESNTMLLEKGLINPDVASFTPETLKAATIIVTIVPILVLYPFLQKYFVKGIMLGGVKG